MRRRQQKTSIDAYRAGDWVALEDRMHAFIVERGEVGVTLHEMMQEFPEFPGTTLSSSIGHLVWDGRVFRRGDTRKGLCRQQLVTRDIALAPTGHVPQSDKPSGEAFFACLRWVRKKLEEFGDDVAAAKSYLDAEMNQHMKGT